jgi:two-component system chemotaxis response regulator CheY
MATDILIVDDDKQICNVLNQFCKNMGCFKNIIFAHDGVAAANKLKNQKFDVIILDLNLPKISGVDVIKEIVENKRSLNLIANIIVISGSLEKEKMDKLISYKCRNFLTKPFDEATFQEKVLKVLKGSAPPTHS